MESLGPNGRWVVTGVLGSGGFSTVYSANDTRFESPVAIKVLSETMAADPDVRQRFLSEALLLRQNPGAVVPVYDTGETPGGQPFIVMPLADGGDLTTRIEQWRRTAEPSPDDVRDLAEILSHVLARLHEQGVVHRDLKPSNLLIFGARPIGAKAETRLRRSLIAQGETVLLGDLGFAKDLARNSGLTVAGGTPGYTPPEQRHPGLVDQRADIWAASAILYWFLAGCAPSDSSQRRRETLGAGPTVGLVDAIEAGLAEDPADRPPSIAAWYRNIDAALAGGQAAKSGSPRRRLRAGLLFFVGAVLFVAGLAAAMFSGLGGGDTVAQPIREVETSTVVAEDIEISITGPSVIERGSTVTYIAEIDQSVTEWSWIDPTGAVLRNEPNLELEATDIGVGTVTLTASAPSGERIRVAIDIEVVP